MLVAQTHQLKLSQEEMCLCTSPPRPVLRSRTIAGGKALLLRQLQGLAEPAVGAQKGWLQSKQMCLPTRSRRSQCLYRPQEFEHCGWAQR